MAKDPAVLLYTADFLVGCMTMTNEQVGKYIRLLCLQHQKGHLTESQMLSVCGEYDAAVFEHFKQDEKGLYFNERMDIESQKRRSYSKSRSNNRKSSSSVPPTEDKTDICYSYGKHMENVNENVNEIEKRSENVNRKSGAGKKTSDVFSEFSGDNAELLSALRDFEKMRKSIKKPMTDRAKKMLVNKLARGFTQDLWILVLEQSINRCWIDIYPLKEQAQQKQGNSVMEDLKQLHEMFGDET